MSDKTVRPPHTSMAAGFVIGGSVGIVLTIVQQLSGLHSLETQEQVRAFLSQSPGSALGLDLESALSWLRVTLMVVAGCATAAAVLGVQVLRRSRGARAGLTLLALPIFFGGFVAGGFLTALVAASTALLWVGPSGKWLHDGPVTTTRGYLDRREIPATDEPNRSTRVQSDPTSRTIPGQPPPPRPGESAPPQPLFQTPPPAPRHAPQGRPDAVVWACVLVWAFCGLVVVVMTASAALLAGNPDLVLDQVRQRDDDLAFEDTDLLVRVTYITAAVVVIWSIVAAVFAALAYRRSPGGRMGLLVSAAVAGVVCLAGAVTSLLMVVPAGAALTTVALLSRPEVRAWYAAR